MPVIITAVCTVYVPLFCDTDQFLACRLKYDKLQMLMNKLAFIEANMHGQPCHVWASSSKFDCLTCIHSSNRVSVINNNSPTCSPVTWPLFERKMTQVGIHW